MEGTFLCLFFFWRALAAKLAFMELMVGYTQDFPDAEHIGEIRWLFWRMIAQSWRSLFFFSFCFWGAASAKLAFMEMMIGYTQEFSHAKHIGRDE